MPDPINVIWDGSLFVHHSLAMINREVLVRLCDDPRFRIRHAPYEPDAYAPDPQSAMARLTGLRNTPMEGADITVRHRWPASFDRPSTGQQIFYGPWEYGYIPKQWFEAIERSVDEVWAPSGCVRDTYIRSGISPEKVAIVNPAVDPRMFHPEAAPAPAFEEQYPGTFRFLFVGGVNARKGTDILVNAYVNEFSRDEHVCLIIKDTPYYSTGMARKIEPLTKRTDIPPVCYLRCSIHPDELPGLYRAAHCYVHPYRAEGFGMPVAEAMACGLPVITTEGGSSADFADSATAYFVPAVSRRFDTRFVADIELVDNGFWLEPDLEALRERMRFVFEHRVEAARTGARAAGHIRRRHTWRQCVDAVTARLLAAAGR